VLCDFIEPLAVLLGFPKEIVPMALLRPVSGGGSTALLNQVLKDYGPDSFLGRCASVIAGSTETTFYAVTIYYSAVKIKKIRHTLVAALMADFVAVVVSVIAVRWLF
jgi:spore maturation protein B